MSEFAAPGARERVFDRELIRISVVVLLGTLMSIIDTTIVNVAIPTLGRDLRTTLSTIQWATTSYMLALAVAMPLTRWVIDRVGAKSAYIGSLGLFILSSVLCGMAWSTTSLILFRALQGVAGGMLVPVGQTILTRTAGPHRMGRVMSVVAAPSMLGVVMGPVLGGLIIVTLGWRWIFYVNVPLGIAAIALSVVILQADRERSKPPLDFTGLLLLPPGLALLVYGFAQLGNRGSISTSVLVGLVAGPLLIVSFVLRSVRISEPLLNVRLFGNRRFLTANVALLVFTGATVSGPFLTTLYYQIGRGYSALGSGMFQASMAFGSAATMSFSGHIMDRSGPRRLVFAGTTVTVISILPWVFLTPTTSTTILALSLFVRGLGVGCVGTPLMAAGYAALQRSDMPTATTLSNIVQRVGGAVGLAIIAVVLQRAIYDDLPSRPANLSSVPSTRAGREAVAPMLAHAFNQADVVFIIAIASSILVAFFLPRSTSRVGRIAPADQQELVAAEEQTAR